MRILALAALYIRLGLLLELQYRVNFIIQLFQAALSLGSALAGLAIVFEHTDEVAGWKAAEIRALIGVYMLVGSVIQLVIRPGMERLMQDVRTGTLDFMLIRPEDAQLLASIRRWEVWKVADFALGAGMLTFSLWQMGTAVTAERALMFALFMACGLAVVYAFWLMLATTVFWFVRIDNILVIFQSMYEAGRWPLGMYPPWLRAALTFLVPVAFAVTVPAEALVGRNVEMSLGAAALLALAMLIFSRWFWKLGLKHYSGASA